MTERKVDRERRLAAERQRRRRARLRGEVDPGPGRPAPPPAAPVDLDESPADWIERTCTTPSGPSRGEPLRLYRWQRAILDTLDNRLTVLRCAAQSGKTALALGALAYRLRRGSPSLVVAPDASNSALALTRRRVERQIACCPELAALAQVTRSTVLGQSGKASLRTFGNGASLRTAGAQSPVQLSSEDAETVIGDELARWPMECGDEGDPVLLVERSAAGKELPNLVRGLQALGVELHDHPPMIRDPAPLQVHLTLESILPSGSLLIGQDCGCRPDGRCRSM